MKKHCSKCNSELSDVNSVLCRDCELQARRNQEALYARKRKAFQAIMNNSIAQIEEEEEEADYGDAPPSEEPEYGRCTICFQEFYGVGAHCSKCKIKLDKSAEEWDMEIEAARKRRDELILRCMLYLSAILLVIGFILVIVHHTKHRIGVRHSPVPAVTSPLAPTNQTPAQTSPTTDSSEDDE